MALTALEPPPSIAPMSGLRRVAQRVVKSGFAALGLHVRYDFQFPSALDARVIGRFFARLEEVTVVFDVGAHHGQSALALEANLPSACIYSFEPFSAIHAELLRRTQDKPRISAFRLAMGAGPATIEAWFDGDAESQLNRLGPSARRAGGRPETLTVCTVDAVCEQHGIDHIDLLKTDTEGHDVEVLRGAERMLRAGGVRLVVAEAGFLDDRHHSRFEELHATLAPYGFETAGVYEMTYLRDGRCDFCNVLFARRA